VPTGANVHIIPSSIASDGSRDVGPAISAWLDSLPRGSIAVFTNQDTRGFRLGVDRPVATYRLAPGIIFSRPDLTLWGYGTKLHVAGDGGATNNHHYSAIRFWSNGKATIRGFEIAGDNTRAGTTTAHVANRQFAAGISIAGDNSVDVFDTWIHHTYGDGIFVAGWGDTDYAPYGYEWAYNLVELTGRYAFTANQNDSGTAWFHHNILRDTALYLIGGEDQRLGTERMVNVLIEENDLGTFSWHDTDQWLPRAVSWLYDYWAPLPNVAEVGPVTIRNNRFTGGAAPATFARWGSHVVLIDQKGVRVSPSDYHDWVVTNNDFSGVPANQRTVAYWARIHNTRNVTLSGNDNLGAMAGRYTTTGSSGVTVNGNG
jgi:hypothetical protein